MVVIWVQVSRLLELLRHDDCDDPVACDCSLHLGANDDDATADLHATAASCGTTHRPPRSTQARSSGADQQDSSPTAPDLTGGRDLSTIGDHDALSGGRCRTFKLPDVQVRHTSVEQPAAAGVVSTPDVVSEPHYTVV